MFENNNFIPQLSVDCVIFGYHNKILKALATKLRFGDDLFTLPGGFVNQNESIEAAASRVLAERTGLRNIYLEQFRTFGGMNRINHSVNEVFSSDKSDFIKTLKDNFNPEWFARRFVSVGFYALVDINKVVLKKTDLDQSIDWYDVEDMPSLIMDHNEMVVFALETLRQYLDQKLIGFNLLPETFTMREVQGLYEAIYNKTFTRSNFQKRILDLDVLERLEKKFTGAANKAPYLYRFKN